jgi:hypothetical protein
VSKKRKEKTNLKKKPDATKKYFNPRVRAELWDMDYADKLSPEELDYYKRFMSEYANATLTVEKDPLIQEYSKINGIGYKKSKKEMIGGGYKPSKNEGKPTKGHVHKKKEHVKAIFDDNNKRNNDVYGVTKINGLLEMDLAGLAMNRDIWNETDPNITEDVMLLSIDVKRNPENYPEIFEEQKKTKKKD